MARRELQSMSGGAMRPTAGFRSQTGQLAAAPSRPRFPFDDRDEDAGEHRRFPRARLEVRFAIWMGEPDDLKFSATLNSDNLSVSGAFLESTFFLPIGTEVFVRFALEGAAEPVEARAMIVREERSEERSGFGIRFEEFFGQSEVTLARLFLADQLRSFVTDYLKSDRATRIQGEVERVVDALAAWELLKVSRPEDPWSGTGG